MSFILLDLVSEGLIQEWSYICRGRSNFFLQGSFPKLKLLNLADNWSVHPHSETFSIAFGVCNKNICQL